MLTTKLLSIALGGAIGTLLRYGVSGLTYRYTGPGFPWGTLAVNLIGSFVIGVLWSLFDVTAVGPNVRIFVLIGVLGGFTTFSTYSLECFNLLRDGEMGLALCNVVASNVLGIALTFFGFGMTRSMINLFG